MFCGESSTTNQHAETGAAASAGMLLYSVAVTWREIIGPSCGICYNPQKVIVSSLKILCDRLQQQSRHCKQAPLSLGSCNTVENTENVQNQALIRVERRMFIEYFMRNIVLVWNSLLSFNWNYVRFPKSTRNEKKYIYIMRTVENIYWQLVSHWSGQNVPDLVKWAKAWFAAKHQVKVLSSATIKNFVSGRVLEQVSVQNLRLSTVFTRI